MVDVEPHRAAIGVGAGEQRRQHRRADTTPAGRRGDDQLDQLEHRRRAADDELTDRHVALERDPRLEAVVRALTHRRLAGEEGLEHLRRPARRRELGALPLEEQPGEKRAVSLDRASNAQLRDGKMPSSAMQKFTVR